MGWSSSDSKIPEDDSKADFSDSYAFEEAVRAEQLEALKKMQAEKYPDRSSRPAGQACVRTHAECLANSLLKTVSSTRTHRRWSTMRLAERYVQTLSRNALSAPRQALGHNSKAVHRAYAKRALMNIPSLEDYERKAAGAAMEKAS